MSRAAFTYDELLAVWRALVTSAYGRPLEEEAEGQGFDPVSATARLLERVSEAVELTTQAYYLRPHSTQLALPASGGRFAFADAEIRRVQGAASVDLTFVAGTLVRTQWEGPTGPVDGPLFVLNADVTLAAGAFSVVAELRASRVGAVANVRQRCFRGFAELGRAEVPSVAVSGNTLTTTPALDRITRAMVGRYVAFPSASLNALAGARRILSVTTLPDGSATVVVDGAALVAETTMVHVLELADLGVELVATSDATGGAYPVLDEIGLERVVPRRAGENDADYRERIAELADTISPGAMTRIATRILSPLGIPWELRETRDPGTWFGFVYDVSAYDVGDEFEGYVGGCDEATSFVIAVGLSNAGEFGSPYDATNATVPNAWDEMFFDGAALAWLSALGALWSAINAARAAGVCFHIVLDPSL